MPYYSYPVGTDYPELAYAFNKRMLQEVLRGELGFEGIINSHTGPIEMMPWGVEELSIPERYKMALEAGVNLFSGTADPGLLLEALRTYSELTEQVDRSVYLLLLEKFRLGLFEDPYVDVSAATATVGQARFQERADVAMRKSIVLLRNGAVDGEKVLPLPARTKVYFTTYVPWRGGDSLVVYRPEPGSNWPVDFVDAPEAADRTVLWVLPRGKSLFQSDGSPLHVNLSANGIDVDHLRKLVYAKGPGRAGRRLQQPLLHRRALYRRRPAVPRRARHLRHHPRGGARRGDRALLTLGEDALHHPPFFPTRRRKSSFRTCRGMMKGWGMGCLGLGRG